MPDYKFTIGSYPSQLNSKIKILTEQRFGRLLVIGFAGIDTSNLALWHCLCDCRNGITVRGSHLRRGTRHSCGCLRTSRKPSTYKISPERSAFYYARARCTNKQHREYPRYGERGIEFRFNSFEEFFAEVGLRPPAKQSLDRIDNEGHYEKGNIQWATKQEQDTNKRTNRHITAFGITQCLSQWESAPTSHRGRIATRLKQGWCVECSIKLPVGNHCPHQ